MFERYTESARRMLFFARYEASVLGGRTIETEHLLLGLARAAEGVTRAILANGDASPERIRGELERRSLGRDREKMATSVELPFSEETRRVLEYAAQEANGFLHGYIGTEHLLLGLLREPKSVAGAILTSFGLEVAQARKTLTQMLGEGSESQPQRLLALLERARTLVAQLAETQPYTEAAWQLREEINGALDELKRFFQQR